MRTRALVGALAASGLVVIGGVELGLAHDAQREALLPPTPSAPAVSPAPTVTMKPVPTGTPTSSPAPTATPIPTETPLVPAVKDGTYDGSTVSTRYGTVQVSVTISKGEISDVTALKLTDQDGRSVQISNRAAPILRSEVLDSQSANVSNVSGATYTTDGYLSSLQSALDLAGFTN